MPILIFIRPVTEPDKKQKLIGEQKYPLKMPIFANCAKYSKIDGVDIVLGANEKFNLLKYLDGINIGAPKTVKYSDIDNVKKFKPSFSLNERTRSYLKVQDGCDYTCSFCTIPLARGRSRSGSIPLTIKAAEKIAKSDKKEIVLTGVNIGDFGKGSDDSFIDLINELDRLKGIDRIRISSIEPNLLKNEIIEFCNSSTKFMPHFHIPLQSVPIKYFEP